MSDAAASQRILTLDIAKGVGIVLVVLGHNALFRSRVPEVWEAIYLFHMPLFFFVSGVTFRVAPPAQALAKRARSLLVPYFVMCALGLLAAILGRDAIDQTLAGIAYSTGQTIRFVPTWFLPCLFLVSMAATLLLSGARVVLGQERYEQRRTAILGVMAVAGIVIGTLILDSRTFASAPYVDEIGRPLGLPWSLDLLPLTLGLFLVGTLAARAPLVHRCPQPWIVMLAAAGVLAAITASGASFDLNYRRMTHPLGALAGMTAGVLLVLAASTLISRVRWAAQLFGYLGSASLVILMVHAPLQLRLLNRARDWGLDDSVAVIGSVVLTIAVIALFDLRILRRIRAVGWVVYPRRDAVPAPA